MPCNAVRIEGRESDKDNNHANSCLRQAQRWGRLSLAKPLELVFQVWLGVTKRACGQEHLLCKDVDKKCRYELTYAV